MRVVTDTSDFILGIEPPQPERARISTDYYDLEEYPNAWTVIGLLNIYEPIQSQAAFNWVDFGEHGFPILWGGNDQYILIYWSSKSALEAETLHPSQPKLEPGIHLIQLNDEGQMRRLKRGKERISIDLEPWWEPHYEICR